MSFVSLTFKHLQVAIDGLQLRLDASEMYLDSVIAQELDKYKKGEWLGLVRARARELKLV